MALSYSVLASTPFKFYVGHKKKLLMVHSALIAHHSKPLDVLVNGDMSEAKEGCVWLEDIDEDTFVRFCQYAYTGDYSPRDPDILLDSTPFFATTKEGDLFGSVLHKSKAGRKSKVNQYKPFAQMKTGYEPVDGSLKSELWDGFKSRAYWTSGPAFQPRQNCNSCEDYTEVFFCHARLYVFADKYDIELLRSLSLHKLHRTLAEFTLYSERVGDIVELIRYCYSNTADRSGSIDDLRSLLTHYAACVVEDLALSDDFKSLLREPGSMAGDLVEQMLKRLN